MQCVMPLKISARGTLSVLNNERNIAMENMIDALKQENCYLKSELQEMKCVLDKRSVEFEQKCKENQELQFKIKFLEGQIEAYQYTMNCRR